MRKDIKKEEEGEISDDGCILLIILALILWSCVQTCTHTEEILEIEHRIENNIINNYGGEIIKHNLSETPTDSKKGGEE